MFPFIPGHEIVGTVTAIGSRVSDRNPGERVGIGRLLQHLRVVPPGRRARHNVTAITVRFAMKDANQAILSLKKNKVRYSAVLAN